MQLQTTIKSHYKWIQTDTNGLFNYKLQKDTNGNKIDVDLEVPV